MKNMILEIIFEILNEQINSRLGTDEEIIGEIKTSFEEIILSYSRESQRGKNCGRQEEIRRMGKRRLIHI